MSSRPLILAVLLAASVSSEIVAAGRDQVRGNLIITVADYFAQGRSETRYFIKDELGSGRTFEIHFTTEPSGGLTTGTSVGAQGRISGTLLEDAEIILPTRLPGTKPGLPAITPVSGVQKTLVYVLEMAASPSRFTNSQLYDIMYAESGLSMNTFYQENSFGSVSFEGDVVGPYTITDPSTCDTGSIRSQAESAAAAAGVDASAYPHRVYMIPDEMQNICQFGGLSVLGGNPGFSWINTGYYYPTDTNINVVLGHELGHQLNMQHAQAIQSDGTLIEYGNNSCVMGDLAYDLVDFHVIHRIEEGWIPLSNIQQVTGSGVYQVNFAETQTTAVQAIQVFPPGSDDPLYISYRQPVGLDANLLPAFTGGASIDFWAGWTGKTQLATYYPWGGALSDGQSYVSPYSPAGSLTITQLAHTSTNVTIEIRLGRRFPARR